MELVAPAAGALDHAWVKFADTLPIVAWTAHPDGSIEFVNRRWQESTGIPRDTVIRAGWRAVIHPADVERAAASYADAFVKGAAFDDDVRIRFADGTVRWMHLHSEPVFTGDGAIARWFGVALDVDDRRREEERFRALAETLPLIVWTADSSGSIDWYNPRWYQFTGMAQEESLGWGWQTAYHPDDFLEVMRRWPRSIATGERFEMEFRLRARDGSYHWFLTQIEPQRDADGNVRRWYGSQIDIDAQKSALERTKRVAETLQDVFLPKQLPHRKNLRCDAVYLPAERDAFVGGDWFDAFDLPDGSLVFSIGDVAGHGLEASIIVGRLRQAIFTLSFRIDDPALILGELDRILAYQEPDTIVTAIVGFVDSPGKTLRYASAGHPAPLLANKGDKLATILPGGGPPLGVRCGLELEVHSAELKPDAVLALYTDGMTEFSRDITAAEEKLRASVALLVGNTSIARPAVTVQELVLDDAPTRDDAALLLIQFSEVDVTNFRANPTALEKTWRFHSSDAHTANASRREIITYLRRLAAPHEDVFASELVIGEMLANTVEHAPGLVEVHIDWTKEKPAIAVRDTGPGLRTFEPELPCDEFDENGRGLYLIKTLSEDASVRAMPGYGTELRAVLPLKRKIVS